MKKILPLVLLSTILYSSLTAQTIEPSASVNKNFLQIELESIYSIQKEDSKKMESWSIPSALLRYGLMNGFELQLNAPIIKEKLWENDHLIHSLNKFDDIQIGFSMNLWRENKLLPEASIMIRAILPTDKKFKLNKIGEIISLNFSNKILNKIYINYNLGYAQETDNSKAGFYIVNVSYELNSKLHFFIENFGDFNKESLISHNLNIGGGYNFKHNFMIDLSITKGVNHNLFYTGGIITWVINTN
ncbi:MAG: transporter [Flavobacteriales bacterium]|nr:transporter [Flavobacteriales bacterium]